MEASVVFITLVVFGVPLMAGLIILVAILTHHRRKMEEIRLRQADLVPAQIRSEMETLRDEVRALRDTTTQFDIGIDTKLQQLDRRLSGVELRPGKTAYASGEEELWKTSSGS